MSTVTQRRNPEQDTPDTIPLVRANSAAEHDGQEGGAVQDLDARFTDVGNGRRLARKHLGEFRHCHPLGSDLVYDGRRWKKDDTARVERFAKGIVKDMLREAILCADDAQRTALIKHANHSESGPRIREAVKLARSEPGIPILPCDLDRDPLVLNLANGTLNLDDLSFKPHDPRDYLTKLAPVVLDLEARCQRWLDFLDRVMGGNAALVNYLQRVVGYCLTGSVAEQCLWFLYGTGANGKSTFLHVLLAMFGDYGMQAVSDLLLMKHNDGHPTERADLFGKRFVATVEVEQGRRMAESLTKQLTGGDKVRARKMKKDFFEFEPTHKLFLAANHKPEIRGTDLAIWRRVKLVPFTVTIPDHEKDAELVTKLKKELPGILAWAIRGFCLWKAENSLAEPPEVTSATAEYKAEQDTLAAFISECCVILPEAKVKSSLLLAKYQEWSGDRMMNPKTFAIALKEKGFDNAMGGDGCKLWRGIGLPADGGDEYRGYRGTFV
jgi:putative DNA primase/helicase